MADTVLGFIGLGNMGSAMSARLVDAGHSLIGFDVAGTEGRLPEGGTAASSTADVVQGADVVFLSLPNGKISMAVCEEIANVPSPRTRVVVDLSTIGIAAAETCSATLGDAGITYMDAPVSGGVAGARKGLLAMMVGGPYTTYEEIDHLLAPMAKNRFHMGKDPGFGQAMKLLNNMISAASMAITSEAVHFGEQVGLDLARIVDVLNVSSGRTSASLEKFPRSIIGKTYDYGFSGELMTKDVMLYLENARAANVPDKVAGKVGEVWEAFNSTHPTADFTYVYEFVKDGEQ